jgi:hypothetical protein
VSCVKGPTLQQTLSLQQQLPQLVDRSAQQSPSSTLTARVQRCERSQTWRAVRCTARNVLSLVCGSHQQVAVQSAAASAVRAA